MLFILLLLLASGLQLTDRLSSNDVSEAELYENFAYHFNDPIEIRRTFISISPINGEIFLFSRNENHQHLTRIRETGEQERLPFPVFDDPSNKFMDVSRDGRSLLFWDVSVGRIHRMDLETGILERLDNSFTHRNMYYHAPFLGEDDTIYAAGGFGFWEFKNLLTRFDPDSGEWKEMRARNRADLPRGQYGILVKVDETFHYFLSNYELEGRHLSPLEAWVYTPETESWQMNRSLTTLLARIQPPFGVNLDGSAIYTSSYMVDEEAGLVGFLYGPNNLRANFVILDVRQNRLYTIPITSLGLNFSVASFYSQAHGKWIIVGINETLGARNRLVARAFSFDPEDPLFTEITAENSTLVLTAGLFLLTLTLLSGVFFFYRREGNANGILGSRNRRVVTLQREDESVYASINGKEINPEKDDLINLFTAVLLQMKEDGQAEILTSDLNSHLFNHYPANHNTYFSRNRQKLIRYFNEELGIKFIEERRSKVDKRFKVLSVNLDFIEIDKRAR